MKSEERSAKSEEGGAALTRRDALKAAAAAVAALPVLDATAVQQPAQQAPAKQTPAPTVGPRGGPWDPDLLHPRAGSWPRLLSARDVPTLTVVCHTIIPPDEP